MKLKDFISFIADLIVIVLFAILFYLVCLFDWVAIQQ